MSVSFPNESAEHRTAREALLQEEIALRRAMEAVAATRRNLPPGGLIPEDYVFDAIDPEGQPTKVKLSELFAPGKDSLVIYNFMFPRMKQDQRLDHPTARSPSSSWKTAPAHPAPRFSIPSTEPPNTSKPQA